MNTIQRFARKHPLTYAVVVTFVFILMLVVSAVLGNLWSGGISYGQPGAIAGRLISTAVLYSMVAGMGWLRSGGFMTLGGWKTWLWLLLPLAYAGFASVYAMSVSLDSNRSGTPLTVNVVLFILSAAFLEEVTFRGIILHGMVRAWGSTRRGLAQGVVISSLLFSSIHLLDFLSGRALLNVLLQSVQAAFLGIFLAALVLKRKSIYQAVFFHAVINLAGYLSFAGQGIEPAPSAWLLESLVMLPLAIYGFYLLHDQPKQPIVLSGNSDSRLVG